MECDYLLCRLSNYTISNNNHISEGLGRNKKGYNRKNLSVMIKQCWLVVKSARQPISSNNTGQ